MTAHWKEKNGRMHQTAKGYSFPIFDTLPDGWQVNAQALTAPRGFVWVNNCKSIFDGERKSGFLRQSR